MQHEIKKWRNKFGAEGGFVLVFNGAPYAWRNDLRNPETEQPGALAIAENGETWKATGGDSYHGAKEWVHHVYNDQATGRTCEH